MKTELLGIGPVLFKGEQFNNEKSHPLLGRHVPVGRDLCPGQVARAALRCAAPQPVTERPAVLVFATHSGLRVSE